MMTMNKSIILITMVLVVSTIARSVVTDDDDNSLSPSLSRQQKSESRNDFVKIVKAPVSRISQPVGYSIELECEVIGSPTPIVQWVHGSGQYVNVSLLIRF